MLPDNYGIHEKTVKKAYGSYDVVIGRFLCFAYTIIICAVISVCLPVILCGQRYALQQGPRTIYANTKVRATVNFFGPSSGDTLLLC